MAEPLGTDVAPVVNGAPRSNGTKRRRAQKTEPDVEPEELDPDVSKDVADGEQARGASPDNVGGVNGDGVKKTSRKKASSPAASTDSTPATPASVKSAKSTGDEFRDDPEAVDDEEADPEEVEKALARPPPVHSDYLPLPWKGRLGYACLNTYLRNSNPPVFCSRTTRIASILEHRHPLADPTQPEHPTKNRPDKEKPADVALGQKFVENLCLANVADIAKIIRWNDRYGIKFLRLSSEMFPFASHAEYGYTLDFAAEALASAGKVIAELGHRVTTHPGQFTQLGSPRAPVITASFRDLDYHDQLLTLLKLPEQQDKDAVMILHMGGAFGSKSETLDRFRENYAKLSPSVKNRLVLENDDMSWSVHDLLPVCEELNIPFVLDFHHHNIIFDPTQIREGTQDVRALFPRILATWQRKGITPKMHYSEPTPAAITPTQRRKHSPRVMTLPPCPPDMDLMIEAKDKEQAVFELMRTFKLPGWHTFNDIVPYVRSDDNKLFDQAEKKALTKKAMVAAEKAKETGQDVADAAPARVPDEEIGMGGAEGRVYWPPTMEEYLRPQKRIVKPKDDKAMTPAKKKIEQAKAKAAAARAAKESAEDVAMAVAEAVDGGFDVPEENDAVKGKKANRKMTPAKGPKGKGGKKAVKKEMTPEESEVHEAEMNAELDELDDEPGSPVKKTKPAVVGRRSSARAKGRVTYAEGDEDEE